MRVLLIETLSALREIQNDWDALVQNNPKCYSFQSWQWHYSWCETVLPSIPGAKLHTLAFLDSAQTVVAIVPLYKRPLLGGLFEVIEFSGHRLTYHNDIPIVLNPAPELLDAITEQLYSMIGVFQLLHLRNLNCQSPLCQSNVGLRSFKQCSRLRIDLEDGFESYFQSLGKEFRRIIRRRSKRLAEHCGVSIRRLTGPGNIDNFNRLIELHQRRFQQKGEDTMLAGSVLDFNREIFDRLLTQGKAHIFEAATQEGAIASILVLHCGDTCFAINGGFDPAYSKYAPHKILTLEAIKFAAADSGIRYFDFGPGYESNKFDWRPAVSFNYFLCVGGNNALGRLKEKLSANVFLTALPAIKTAALKNSPPAVERRANGLTIAQGVD